MADWPHQIEGFNKVIAAQDRGVDRLCLTIPTGGGKTRVVERLVEHWADEGHRCAVYANRKLLIGQLHDSFAAAGYPHGIRAAGWPRANNQTIQLCSVQTEAAAARKAAGRNGVYQYHDATRVVIDEGHMHTGQESQEILETHRKAGGKLLYVSATPLDMGGVLDELIHVGKMQELRDCGALCWARVFAPDEPDLKAFRKMREDATTDETADPGGLSVDVIRKAIMTPSIIGRVWKWFNEINPERHQTLLFAPGVGESVWFAEQFTKKGVRAAHIDGANVWVDGEFHRSDKDARRQVLDDSKSGRIVVLSNRFVMREGINAPWIRHMVLATILSSLQSYVQAVGRLLRAISGVDYKTIQDHGGNYWRWGSPNEDREWFVGQTAAMAYSMRAERIRSKKCQRCKAPIDSPVCKKCAYINPVEPKTCPRCKMVLMMGRCANCQLDCRATPRSRAVVSTDGSLREVSGVIFRPKRVAQNNDLINVWERVYWSARSERIVQERGEDGQMMDKTIGWSGTFRQAYVMFAKRCVKMKLGWLYPRPDWPFMPLTEGDEYRLVADVPFDKLVPKSGAPCGAVGGTNA